MPAWRCLRVFPRALRMGRIAGLERRMRRHRRSIRSARPWPPSVQPLPQPAHAAAAQRRGARHAVSAAQPAYMQACSVSSGVPLTSRCSLGMRRTASGSATWHWLMTSTSSWRSGRSATSSASMSCGPGEGEGEQGVKGGRRRGRCASDSTPCMTQLRPASGPRLLRVRFSWGGARGARAAAATDGKSARPGPRACSPLQRGRPACAPLLHARQAARPRLTTASPGSSTRLPPMCRMRRRRSEDSSGGSCAAAGRRNVRGASGRDQGHWPAAGQPRGWAGRQAGRRAPCALAIGNRDAGRAEPLQQARAATGRAPRRPCPPPHPHLQQAAVGQLEALKRRQLGQHAQSIAEVVLKRIL